MRLSESMDPLLPGLLIAAAVSLVLTVGYFALTGGWTNLGNPIASIVAVIAGAIGFAAGQAPRLYLRRVAVRERGSAESQ